MSQAIINKLVELGRKVNEGFGDYSGDSTDVKPTIESPVEGVTYTYLELDTGKVFVLNKGSWREI